jgi:hypothetical protein
MSSLAKNASRQVNGYQTTVGINSCTRVSERTLNFAKIFVPLCAVFVPRINWRTLEIGPEIYLTV